MGTCTVHKQTRIFQFGPEKQTRASLSWELPMEVESRIVGNPGNQADSAVCQFQRPARRITLSGERTGIDQSLF
jgi:hypothetical protein